MTFTSAPQRALANELRNRAGIFRENVRDLPRTPDIVFDKEKLVVFFHGCFWHGHHCRPRPESFVWQDKIDDIREKDSNVANQLVSAGIRVLVLWECEVDQDMQGAIEYVRTRIKSALEQ